MHFSYSQFPDDQISNDDQLPESNPNEQTATKDVILEYILLKPPSDSTTANDDPKKTGAEKDIDFLIQSATSLIEESGQPLPANQQSSFTTNQTTSTNPADRKLMTSQI